MSVKLAAALIYWVIVALWLTVLVTVVFQYVRNPRTFGTVRLLLVVIGIDTCRNLAENIYFGLFFGGQYGFFPSALSDLLGRPELLIVPKLLNVVSGCLVIGLLLMHWLPESVRERDKAEKLTSDLNTLASVDALTKLANRRHFEELAKAEWARFLRYGRPLSVLVIDVDHFKSINDSFGHAVGDQVLQNVANTLAATIRGADMAGRIGGEEFAVLLPETDEAAATVAAERLRQSIAGAPPVPDTRPVTVSIGIAGATPSMASFGVLLKHADGALYQAKASGRNRVVLAPQDIGAIYQMAAE